MTNQNERRTEFIHDVDELWKEAKDGYEIGDKFYSKPNIKRGLRNADGTGVIVGATHIGSVQGYMVMDGERVPMPGKLYYRGIDIHDIVEAHRRNGTFGYEEVAYLLLMGKLPTPAQFARFDEVLSKARQMPSYFFEDVVLKNPSPNIMNMLAKCVMSLYAYDHNPDDNSVENLMRQSIELVGRLPVIVADAYSVKRHHYDGKSLYKHNPKEELSVSQNFLRMLRKDKSYTDEEAKLLDLMLMLHAEHGGGNNSAFVCRAMSSSGTDTYSAIAGAIGSLKGSLHGGANAKVIRMFEDIKANVSDCKDDEELTAYLNKILDGDAFDHSGKIYGLGHAIYTMSDPRALSLKKYARSMAVLKNRLDEFELIESVERLGIPMIMKRKNLDIPICANIDLYSGLVYSMLDIPAELYTPLFAIARIAGWCAHRIEEVMTCNRIMRPAYRAVIHNTPYIPVEKR